MALGRTIVERQIGEAQAALEARMNILKEKKLDEKLVRKDPTRKMLFSTLKKIKNRLVSVEKLEKQNIKRKEEKAAKLAAPKDKKKDGKKDGKKDKKKGGKKDKNAQQGDGKKKKKEKKKA